MNKLKGIFIIVFIVILGIGGFYAYEYLTEKVGPQVEAYKAIPNNNAYILEVKNPNQFLNLLGQDSSFLGRFMGSIYQDSVINDWKGLESLWGESDSSNMESKWYISQHFMGLDHFEFLWSVAVGDLDMEHIKSNKKRFGNLQISNYKDAQIYTIQYSNRPIYFTYNRGILSISKSRMLIEKVIFYLQEDVQVDIQEAMSKMMKMSGVGDAHIYINYKYFYRLIAQFAPKYREEVKEIFSWAQYTQMDLDLQGGNMFCNGFSLANDSVSSFQKLIGNQSPRDMKLLQVIPGNTDFLYYLSLNNVEQFFQDFQNLRPAQSQKLVKDMESKNKFDVRNDFESWLEGDIAFCTSNPNSSTSSASQYCILSALDVKEAIQKLDQISEDYCKAQNTFVDSLRYRSYLMRSVSVPYFLNNIFGRIADAYPQSYYVGIGQYVVFANSKTSLQSFIDAFLVGNNILQNETFASVNQRLSNKSNLLVYNNLSNFNTFVSKYLDSDLKTKFPNFTQSLMHWACGLEISAAENGTFTSLALQYQNSTSVDDELVSWRQALDAAVQGQPNLIINHQNKKQEILVFDVDNNLYRIDNQGNIIWKIPILEKALSPISTLDFYKNGKHQFVFNTSNYVYIIDINGNRVENFPMKLESAAIGSMSLMDYDHKRNYRILIPQEDHILHNYTLEAKPTVGWTNPNFDRSYLSPVKHYRLGKKDFLLFTDTLGNVVFANRRGESRIEAKLAFTNNPNTAFFKDGKGVASKLITTDLMGRVIEIDGLGNVNKETLGVFSPNHQFILHDVDLDGSKDYIFYDNNRLSVYNMNKDTLIDTVIQGENFDYFNPIRFANSDSLRIIAHNTQGQLWFIYANGSISSENNIPNCDKFLSQKATKSDILRLISIKGRVISNFLIN